ncbi:MAG: FMN-binding glutamate synthase family protein [Flavobacteriales bacterium]|nr:FMN-binding glutamate synthase family protein [Flavobacteriales bacterium]NNK80378.1 FMN-binding glutamate synthase family protein [Flavobacteriales bacterium]
MSLLGLVVLHLLGIPWWTWFVLLILIVAIRDIFFNRHHTISHNFPIVGHIRYMLENVGPELRQYIVANNREELPFNRSQRAWVYSSAKNENNYQGFGTDQDQTSPNFVLIKPDLYPYRLDCSHPSYQEKDLIPCAKVIGVRHNRRKPYRPRSIINIGAMSYGSLSKTAITALNHGSKMAGNYHNTGEGGLSPYHKKGADVCFQFGTGYFGVRNENGDFSMEKMQELVAENPEIKLIELKLSQGAKPGKGGVLPAAKISAEIAEIRGVPMGKDVLSPAYHTAFGTVREMVDFIEEIADITGLPVGIKSAVGKLGLWHELLAIMRDEKKGPDFIAIDGGEGGTGAAPPSFANHVSLPFVYGFTEVYQLLQEYGLCQEITLIASGKLGFPSRAAMAFAMGADIIHVAREAMMSIGCIQAQLCHTNRCPAGIATQNKWLQSGLDIPLKSVRFAQYIRSFRKELNEISHACGYEHPCQFTMDDIKLSMGDNNLTLTLNEIFNYEKEKVEMIGIGNMMDCDHLGSAPSKEFLN